MDDYVNCEDPSRPIQQCSTVPASDFRRISSVDADHGGLQVVSGLNATKPFPSRASVPSTSVAPETTTGRMQLTGIDLNNTYDDSQDHLDNLGNSHAPVNSGTVAHGFPLWMRQDSQKSSPPQTSGTSCSTSSSSSGDAQVYSCTCISFLVLPDILMLVYAIACPFLLDKRIALFSL